MYDLYILLILIMSISLCGSNYYFYQNWDEDRGLEKNLWCPDSCFLDSVTDRDHCCRCNSLASWELNPGDEDYTPIYPIHMLYYDKRGLADLWAQPENKPSSVFSAVYRNERLLEMPRNLCDFPNLSKIDFSNDKLSEIGSIQCLKKLDTLNLFGNRITHVTNQTFKNLPNLRFLDLSGNGVKILDPNSFSDRSVEIHNINFVNNSLKTIDVTNIFLENRYCVINYTNSINGETTNMLDFRFEENTIYGSGIMSFLNSNFTVDPYSVILGHDIRLYQTVFKYLRDDAYFDYSNTEVTCDCKIEPLLEFLFDNPIHYNMFAGNYSCATPEHLKGLSYYDLINNTHLLDKFTCTRKVFCPSNCECFDQPSRKRTVVNCTNTNVKALPKSLPPSQFNYELDFSDNEIEILEDRDYFINVSVLDLSNNKINHIDSESFIKMKDNLKELNLANNKFSNLPNTIQVLTADVTFSIKQTVDCTCENIWIVDWNKRASLLHKFPEMYCGNIKDGNLLVSEITSDMLNCNDDSTYDLIIILLSMCLVLLIVTACVLRFYRYEVLQILISVRKLSSHKKPFLPYLEHDIFISLDENDDDSRPVITRYLVPKLIRSGFSVYLTCIDSTPGETRELVMKSKIRASRCVLVILTKGYMKNPESMMEFNMAWQLYRRDMTKNLIIVNFDNCKAGNIDSAKLRSFLRLRKFIKVAQRHHDIITQIEKILGRRNANVHLNNVRNGRDRPISACDIRLEETIL